MQKCQSPNENLTFLKNLPFSIPFYYSRNLFLISLGYLSSWENKRNKWEGVKSHETTVKCLSTSFFSFVSIWSIHQTMRFSFVIIYFTCTMHSSSNTKKQLKGGKSYELSCEKSLCAHWELSSEAHL